MKTDRRTEVRVGATLLVGLVLILWILGWAKNFTLFSDQPELKLLFDNVSGLEVGDRVTVNGVTRGFVEQIRNEGEGVRVNCLLEENITLHKDAVFRISMLDLMGGKKVEIFDSREGETLDLDNIHRGHFAGDIASVMSSLHAVETDLVDVIKEVRYSLETINNFTRESGVLGKVEKSIDNFNSVANDIKKVISENRGEINSLLKSGNELSGKIVTLIDENRAGIEKSVTGVQDVIKKLDKALTDVNSLLNETSESRNNLGKALYDQKFLDEFEKTISNVNTLLDMLQEQLKDDGIKVDASIF